VFTYQQLVLEADGDIQLRLPELKTGRNSTANDAGSN
jgi:hypothetical protein